jgi:hypothetical protein
MDTSSRAGRLDKDQATTAFANPCNASMYAQATFAGKDHFAANRRNLFVTGKEDTAMTDIFDLAGPIGAVILQHRRAANLDSVAHPLFISILLIHS